VNRHPLPWRASPHAVRLATVALLATAAAIVPARPEPLVIAVPPLVLLAAARRPAISELDVEWRLTTERCFEGEEVELHAIVRAAGRLDALTLTLDPGAVELVSHRAASAPDGSWAEGVWTVRAQRWGRRAVGAITVTALAAGRTRRARLTLNVDELGVFPDPGTARAAIAPAELLARLGDHTSRAVGTAVEFAGVRPYTAGDRPRRINWPVSSRRGELHVNQQSAERAADVVVLLDALSETGPPGDTTLDRVVRGTAAVVRAQLRRADRVGVVALGSRIRWLGPDLGERHFYRIVETVLDVWDARGYRRPDVTRIPPPALPPGALVLVFSPLLDPDAIEVIRDLRERGFTTVVVDVLREEPPVRSGDRMARLALRMWRLDRAALLARLAGLGIPVLTWDGTSSLDTALASLDRRALLPRHS